MRFFAKFTRYEIGRIWVKEWVVVDDWAMEWTSTFFPPPLPPLSKHFCPPRSPTFVPASHFLLTKENWRWMTHQKAYLRAAGRNMEKLGSWRNKAGTGINPQKSWAGPEMLAALIWKLRRKKINGHWEQKQRHPINILVPIKGQQIHCWPIHLFLHSFCSLRKKLLSNNSLLFQWPRKIIQI